jgi:aminomethyltransferase
VRDAHDRYAMLAVQARGRARSVQAMADAPLPNRFTTATRLLCGAVRWSADRYTGEDGVEILCDPADAAPLWDELGRRGAAPRACGARHAAPRGLLPPLRQRPHGGARPIEAGLGWCCKEDTGFIGSDAVRAAARRPRARSSRPSR